MYFGRFLVFLLYTVCMCFVSCVFVRMSISMCVHLVWVQRFTDGVNVLRLRIRVCCGVYHLQLGICMARYFCYAIV